MWGSETRRNYLAPLSVQTTKDLSHSLYKNEPTLTVEISNITDCEKINITREYDLLSLLNKAINPLEFNPIWSLLALFGAHHIHHVSR